MLPFYNRQRCTLDGSVHTSDKGDVYQAEMSPRSAIIMDLNKRAFEIVRSLTSEKIDEDKRSTAARTGGKAGGAARAKALTGEQRHAIAVKASRARWKKSA